MSTVEDYSGLCGIIPSFADSGRQIRCKYEFGHSGPCSFEKYRSQFRLWGGCSASGYERWYLNKKDEEGLSNGFKESVLSHSTYSHYSVMIGSDRKLVIR